MHFGFPVKGSEYDLFTSMRFLIRRRVKCNVRCPEKAKDLRSVRHESADVPGVAQIQRSRGSTLLHLGILTQPLTKMESE
jgi:hypothetical protein